MAFVNQAPRQVYPCTDMGVATRMSDEQGHRLRYCQTEDCWYVYANGRWAKENLRGSQRMATETCLAQRIDNPEHQGDLTAAGFIKRILYHAQGFLAVSPVEFDQLTGILNFQNGTLDLRTGELMEHHPGHFLTQQIPYSWDPGADCSVWMQHLNIMTKGDKEIQDLLQLLVGATLWGGSDRDQIFVHLLGKGRQGKGVFIRTLGKALGDYYTAAPINLFTMAESAHTAEYMTLKGSRMVGISEIGTNRLNIGALKMLTGGDDITARAMRQDPITFTNTWISWFATNYSLNTTGDAGDALFERYVPIQLGDMIPEAERDNLIEEKLQPEVMSGAIIQWAVEGCLMWQQMDNKVPLPERVRSWRGEQRENSDIFGAYVEESLEITGSQMDKVILQDLAISYETWRLSNNELFRMSSKMISADLRARYGVTVKAGAGNRRTAYGLRFSNKILS